MAGRCDASQGRRLWRNHWDVCATDGVRVGGNAGAVLLRDAAIRELQGRICSGGADVRAGVFVVYAAAADVWVFVLCVAADRAGVVSQGRELAAVDTASGVFVV